MLMLFVDGLRVAWHHATHQRATFAYGKGENYCTSQWDNVVKDDQFGADWDNWTNTCNSLSAKLQAKTDLWTWPIFMFFCLYKTSYLCRTSFWSTRRPTFFF